MSVHLWWQFEYNARCMQILVLRAVYPHTKSPYFWDLFSVLFGLVLFLSLNLLHPLWGLERCKTIPWKSGWLPGTLGTGNSPHLGLPHPTSVVCVPDSESITLHRWDTCKWRLMITLWKISWVCCLRWDSDGKQRRRINGTAWKGGGVKHGRNAPEAQTSSLEFAATALSEKSTRVTTLDGLGKRYIAILRVAVPRIRAPKSLQCGPRPRCDLELEWPPK